MSNFANLSAKTAGSGRAMGAPAASRMGDAPQRTTPTATLSTLPAELFWAICQRLDSTTLRALACVSRGMEDAVGALDNKDWSFVARRELTLVRKPLVVKGRRLRVNLEGASSKGTGLFAACPPPPRGLVTLGAAVTWEAKSLAAVQKAKDKRCGKRASCTKDEAAVLSYNRVAHTMAEWKAFLTDQAPKAGQLCLSRCSDFALASKEEQRAFLTAVALPRRGLRRLVVGKKRFDRRTFENLRASAQKS